MAIQRKKFWATLRKWHNWTGIAVLLVLLFSGISGSALVFKSALIQLLITSSAPLPADYNIEQIAVELDQINSRYQLNEGDRLKVPNGDDPYWIVSWLSGEVLILEAGTVEPYQRNLWLLGTLEFIRHFHKELFLGVGGEAILFTSGLSAMFLLFSGIALWWRARKGLHWRWLIPTRLKPQMLIAYHLHMGAVIFFFLLPVLVTGTTMLQQKLSSAIFSASKPSSLETIVSASREPVYLASDLLNEAAAVIPDGWPTFIRLPSEVDSRARLRFRLPGEWHSNGRSNVNVDADSQEIVSISRSDKASPGRKILNQMYPLHSGYGLSGLYSFLVFFAGSGLCWLAYTGGISWYSKRIWKRKHALAATVSKPALAASVVNTRAYDS